MKRDDLIFELIEKEHQRQLKGIELIASENFVRRRSKACSAASTASSCWTKPTSTSPTAAGSCRGWASSRT